MLSAALDERGGQGGHLGLRLDAQQDLPGQVHAGGVALDALDNHRLEGVMNTLILISLSSTFPWSLWLA